MNFEKLKAWAKQYKGLLLVVVFLCCPTLCVYLSEMVKQSGRFTKGQLLDVKLICIVLGMSCIFLIDIGKGEKLKRRHPRIAAGLHWGGWAVMLTSMTLYWVFRHAS